MSLWEMPQMRGRRDAQAEEGDVGIYGAYVICPRYLLAGMYVGEGASLRSWRRAVRKMQRRVSAFRPFLQDRDGYEPKASNVKATPSAQEDE